MKQTAQNVFYCNRGDNSILMMVYEQPVKYSWAPRSRAKPARAAGVGVHAVLFHRKKFAPPPHPHTNARSALILAQLSAPPEALLSLGPGSKPKPKTSPARNGLCFARCTSAQGRAAQDSPAGRAGYRLSCAGSVPRILARSLMASNRPWRGVPLTQAGTSGAPEMKFLRR